MKTHQFDISASFDKPAETTIQMDGKDLQAVEAFVLKVGANGYSNINVSFCATSVISVVAHLTASIDNKAEAYYGLYDKAMYDFEGEEMDADDKAAFIGRLLENLIERFS